MAPTADRNFTSFKDVHFKGFRGENADTISGDAADPDGDGWPNLFEMAYGTDPLDAASSPPVTAADAAGYTLGDDQSPNNYVSVERVAVTAPNTFGTVHLILPGSGDPVLKASRTQ